MGRAGVLVASVLLAVLTGCEPGGGTGATPTSTVPNLEAHTSVLDVVRAADEAAKQKGSAFFKLSGGKPPKPFGAGRLVYRKRGSDMLIRTLQRKQNIEVRAIGDALFARPSGQVTGMVLGKPWITLPMAAQQPLAQVLAPAMVKAREKVDPTQAFDLLVASGTLAASDRVRLGDAELTRYEIDVDVAELAEHIENSSPAQARQQLVTSLRTAADQGKAMVSAWVWLDHNNLPRKLRITDIWALPAPRAGKVALPKITVAYRDWGKAPKRLAPPPPGSVAAMPG
ncbi:MAG: hypothetical protein GEV04_09265 [Actinophytocola sp.]|nr:hypothetical protein [Actinophytocola sp.]